LWESALNLESSLETIVHARAANQDQFRKYWTPYWFYHSISSLENSVGNIAGSISKWPYTPKALDGTRKQKENYVQVQNSVPNPSFRGSTMFHVHFEVILVPCILPLNIGWFNSWATAIFALIVATLGTPVIKFFRSQFLAGQYIPTTISIFVYGKNKTIVNFVNLPLSVIRCFFFSSIPCCRLSRGSSGRNAWSQE
jgi:hypothetical protein